MAVRKKEELFSKIQERFGNDTSDEGMSFVEDMFDTYNDLENKAKGDGTDWKAKYNELNETWKKKYQHRFFSGGVNNIPVADEEDDDEDKREKIGIKDLFTACK